MSEGKGHISKERWEEMGRDPEQWRSEESWKERGDKILPIVQKNLADMTDNFNKASAEVAEIKKTMGEFKDFFQKSRQSDSKKAYQQALKDIAEQQRVAVGEANTEEFDRLEGAKGQLYQNYTEDMKANTPPESAKVVDDGPKISKEEMERADAFVKRNNWFDEDPVMKAYAKQKAFNLIDDKGNIDYIALEKDVKARFPEKFTNPNRANENTVEGGGTIIKQSGKKTWDDLPADAKSAYARFAKQIPGYKKEDYLSNYVFD